MPITDTVKDELHEIISDSKRAKGRHFFAAKRCGFAAMALTVAAVAINAVIATHVNGNASVVQWLSAAAAICSGLVVSLKLNAAASEHWRVANMYTAVYRDGRLIRAKLNSGLLNDATLCKAVEVLLKDYKHASALTANSHTSFFDRWFGEPHSDRKVGEEDGIRTRQP
ncbi:hypothetical protein [Ralstonia pseudosolanacearum]|uniref:hypothetical protein n=1 Tax=Ralstonia pseudosolanacearum TaxID=1310165 RepID=UPI0011B58A04|nr:hypothetical protein [Ralstonia pseudosolanacearum]